MVATDGKSGEECFRMMPNHEHVIQDLYNRIVKKDRAYLTKLSTDYAKFAARDFKWYSFEGKDASRFFAMRDWVEWSEKYALRSPKHLLVTINTDPEMIIGRRSPMTPTESPTFRMMCLRKMICTI